VTDRASITSEAGAGAPVENGREPAVRIVDLVKEFPGGVRALGGLTFDVPKGELTSIIGPSGCGKTTTLKIVAGLADATSGRVEVGGAPVTGPGPDRAFVFQDFALLPWATVLRNVAFGLELRGLPRKEREETARAYVDKMGLSGFEDSYPHQLSGGMRQRVGLARALAVNADILLMDEPFASLDALTRRQMQEELLGLWDDTRFTVLFVTHSIEEALLVGSRILVLSPHPGQVKAELNANQHSHANLGSPEFVALQARIHDMLFADRVLEDEIARRG
jgi:NitT/TauT family transport system ATP-binding protein